MEKKEEKKKTTTAVSAESWEGLEVRKGLSAFSARLVCSLIVKAVSSVSSPRYYKLRAEPSSLFDVMSKRGGVLVVPLPGYPIDDKPGKKSPLKMGEQQSYLHPRAKVQ